MTRKRGCESVGVIERCSWDELASLSQKMSNAYERDAMLVAAGAGLVGADGRVSRAASKEIVLRNGIVLRAHLVGILHDISADGSRLGMSFITQSFDSMIAEGGALNGYSNSEIKSFLETMVSALPADLAPFVKPALKRWVGFGGGIASEPEVFEEPFAIWAPAIGEVVSAFSDVESECDGGRVEGSQYELFAEWPVHRASSLNLPIKQLGSFWTRSLVMGRLSEPLEYWAIGEDGRPTTVDAEEEFPVAFGFCI